MKTNAHIISALMLLLCSACTDDYDAPPSDVVFCVQAAWQDGRPDTDGADKAPAARSLTATDLLAGGSGDITIAPADYPATIQVHCSNGNDLTLTKGTGPCDEHTAFWHYSSNINIKEQEIVNNDLRFTATATIDPVPTTGDELQGVTTQANLHDGHLQFTLHHTKALLRFAFKVSEKYDKVRYIVVTGININGNALSLKENIVLTTDTYAPLAYIYLDTETFDTSASNTILCTYNIYDKDPSAGDSTTEWDAHLTRQGVTAQNTFALNRVLGGSPLAQLTHLNAGYYYDLRITLNPDYIYVLAEHDNKHISIE